MPRKGTTRKAVVVWGHRIGTLRTSDVGELLGADLLPPAYAGLRALEERGFAVHLAIPGTAPGLLKGGPARFFPSNWHVRSVAWHDPERDAAQLCESASSADLFIAGDRTIRAVGAHAGLAAWPDPASALLAATHGPLVFVRLTGDVLALQSDREFVPYFLEAQAHGHWMALGLASTAALGRCIARGFQAAVVPLDPHTEDPLLVHLDKVDREAQAALGRVKVLYSEGRRLLVGVGPDLVNDDIALHGAHGHYVVLWPEPLLWDRSSQRDRFEPSITTALGRLPQKARQVRRDVPGHDISVLLTPTCPASPAQFEADSDRYTGVAPLDGAGTIASRHYRHPDNMRAVDALMLDLQNMGYYPFRHEFEFGGRTLHNVIADLPGKGRFFLRPEI